MSSDLQDVGLIPKRIHRLSPQMANQIAAGEVVERPASVVKELLENALDAGAKNLTIELDYGGLNLIRISDDGVGIVAEDLPLAVTAHATSKVEALSDLFAIDTMGFRGEALASIASVSKFSMLSKTKDEREATKLVVNAGSIFLSTASRAQGTTVEVKDLFCNAPVRKRFLKSERSEFLACDHVVKRFALGAPSIGVAFYHNGKLIFKLPPALTRIAQAERVAKIMGRPFIQNALKMDVERAEMRLSGWLGGLSDGRSQSDKIWIYLNGRMVRDKLLLHALKQAYEGLLPLGRHPICLLYLKINTQEVDVNVHPTKHEVRFSQPRLVHDFLISQIQALLGETCVQKALSTPIAPKNNPKHQEETSTRTTQWQFPLREGIQLIAGPYALYHQAQAFYLVHLQKLYTFYKKIQLAHLMLPWVKRPVLVPLSFDVILHPDLQEVLAPFGFELDIKNHVVTVEAFPALFPDLDLKAFIHALSSYSMLLPTECVDLLCQYGTPLLAQLEHDKDFLAFLETHLHSSEAPHGIKKMDQEACEGIFND